MSKFFRKNILMLAALFIFGRIAFAADVNEISIRVAVQQDADSITLKTSKEIVILKEGNGNKSKLSKNSSFSFKAEKGHVKMSGHILASPVKLSVYKKRSGLNFGKFESFYDVIIYAKDNSKLDITEIIPLEKYIEGVIASEMGSSWPEEALKAQAVASRSYVLANLKPKANFDVTADTKNQVFKHGKPSKNVAEAVSKTEGLVLKYGNKILPGFFHSHCAGHTQDPKSIWKGQKEETPKPLKGQKDPYCAAKPFHWKTSVKTETILFMAKKKKPKIKKIINLSLGKKDESGRTINLIAQTDKGNVYIKTVDLRANERMKGNMKSTAITSIKKTKSGWTFAGKGNGHGAGMCQWGAKAMADSRKSYMEILGHYYPGAAIEKY